MKAMLLLHAVAAMCASESAIRALSTYDAETFAAERIKANPHLREQTIDEHSVNVRIRVALLRRRLLTALLLMGSAAAAAWLSAQYFAPVQLSAGQLGAASAFVFAWAGLSRLGWGGQSFKGTTSVELADTWIFEILCWCGMYLATAAVL